MVTNKLVNGQLLVNVTRSKTNNTNFEDTYKYVSINIFVQK